MPLIDVKVPDIGDFKNVPVIEIHVKPGDTVKPEDPLVSLESDKATMEVPAPSAGKIAEVLVKVGDKVSEGTAILRFEGEGGSTAPETKKSAPAASPPASKPASAPAPASAPPAALMPPPWSAHPAIQRVEGRCRA